jgi:O-antigen/teichoic acid export membrane protein
MEFIRTIFRTSTFRQSSITFIATVINGALGAIFFIFAARFLGPSQYGLFSIAMAVLTLTADIGNLGTDTGVVNFVSKYIKTDSEKAYRFLKLALSIKFIVGILILLIGWLIAPTIAITLFHKPELSTLLQIAFVGVLAQLLFTFGTSALQSLQKFVSWGVVNVGQNTIRLILLFIIFSSSAFVTHKFTPESAFLLYALIPFTGFLIAMIILPKKFLMLRNQNSVARDFFKYNVWVAAFGAIAAFSSRLDTFISARLLDSAQIGIYAAANQLVLVVPQLVGALGTVIAPKMAQQTSKEKFIDYLKKTQLMVLGLAGLGLLSIPVILWIIPSPYLFGMEYLQSGPIFVVLLLSMLIFLISVPIHMSVFYYYSYPKLFFWISLGHLAIIAIVGWNLISIYGVMGAAWTVLIGQVFNLMVPAIWVLNKIKNKK